MSFLTIFFKISWAFVRTCKAAVEDDTDRNHSIPTVHLGVVQWPTILWVHSTCAAHWPLPGPWGYYSLFTSKDFPLMLQKEVQGIIIPFSEWLSIYIHPPWRTPRKYSFLQSCGWLFIETDWSFVTLLSAFPHFPKMKNSRKKCSVTIMEFKPMRTGHTEDWNLTEKQKQLWNLKNPRAPESLTRGIDEQQRHIKWSLPRKNWDVLMKTLSLCSLTQQLIRRSPSIWFVWFGPTSSS